MSNLNQLSAAEAARLILAGQASSVELVQDCLTRIRDHDATVKAWAHLDEDYVLEQARQSDTLRRSGASVGPLHGVPVGVKDIFDTQDFPTECGSPLYSGRRTIEDAAAVARLREAGLIVLGKTVTAELAGMSPGPTTNPHDPKRTPGGSSSGSAAAVAAYMTPLALGTQTNGSVIRPASYCGVVGYKPTIGLISRHRVLTTSSNLDQVGVFARTLEDAALMAEAMVGFDARDKDTCLRPHPSLAAKCHEEPPMPPRLAFVKGPAWAQCEASTREAFGELVEVLGEHVEEVNIDGVYDEVFDWHRRVMEADIARNLGQLSDRAGDKMSDTLKATIARGRDVRAVDYTLAQDRMGMFADGFDEVLTKYDAIITPAATGEAPVGLAATGNPACATLWTFTGVPALSLPLLVGEAGLPLGVQLVSRRHDDARLFRNAAWLEKYIQGMAEGA